MTDDAQRLLSDPWVDHTSQEQGLPDAEPPCRRRKLATVDRREHSVTSSSVSGEYLVGTAPLTSTNSTPNGI